MKSIKTILKNTGKYVLIVGSLITIHSCIDRLKDQKLKNKYNTQLEKNSELENKVNSLFENQLLNEGNKTKIIEAVTRRSDSIDIVRNDVNTIQNFSEDLNKDSINDLTREILTNQLNQQVNKLNGDINDVSNKLDELIDIIKDSSSSNNYIEIIDNIQNLLNSYKAYLSTLNVELLGALSNISVSVLILLCVWSLIFIKDGEYLIEYFDKKK